MYVTSPDARKPCISGGTPAVGGGPSLGSPAGASPAGAASPEPEPALRAVPDMPTDGVARETTAGRALVDVQGFDTIASANQSRQAIHVRVELQNPQMAFVELDAARMDLRAGGRSIEFLAPTIVDGAREVPPQEARNVDFWFALPDGVSRDEVEGFRLRLHFEAPRGPDDEILQFGRSGDDFVPAR